MFAKIIFRFLIINIKIEKLNVKWNITYTL